MGTFTGLECVQVDLAVIYPPSTSSVNPLPPRCTSLLFLQAEVMHLTLHHT